ncbi:ornithine cyclodeaminase [Hydrogenophaga palleronii]|uniref:Ornithine cyclodeaminase n=1 Tax=Hydrogenophaga palleronii TaxID=65655 RepID=A0ABU1WNK3_9BURK|nr:ornithine cyclodeaminase [Hydrogenophaga palleronii]MDR7150874.1 ornithine cyclodeaminase [Hydrogenophaga palleronii]
MKSASTHTQHATARADLARFATTGTLYLSAPEAAELVRRLGLTHCLGRLAEHIRADFLRWADFDKTARVASHSQGGVIELMPVADDHRYSFKYVNGHPGNTRHGLPTVMAFGVLADVDSGAPLFLSELTLTTALRTAAMSALAAQVLARPDSRTMALIGNGAQSEFQALAFRDLVGITSLRVFDVDPAATAKLVFNLQRSGLQVTVCSSTAEAVAGADIVTTVTADKRNALILTPDMIAPGMHLNAVGGDCPGKTELHGDILDTAKVFVEYEPQSRIEGEIQHKPENFAVTELWQVLVGERSGRDSTEQVTVFDSVGFALEDFSALRFMMDSAVRLGLGQRIDLIPRLADPKNLYGSLRPVSLGTSPTHLQPA